MVANFDVRPARSHEADRLYCRYRETALAAYAHIFPPDASSFPEDDERRKWRDLVAAHGHTHQLLVADTGSDLAGAVVAKPGTLERLFVVPSHWGTGVADALHTAALDIAHMAGAERC